MPHLDSIIPVTVTFEDLPSVNETLSWQDIHDLIVLGFEIVTPKFTLEKILDGRQVLFRNFTSMEALEAYQAEFGANDPARMITNIRDASIRYTESGTQNTIDRLLTYHELDLPPDDGGSTIDPGPVEPPVFPPPVEILPSDVYKQTFISVDYRETPEGKTLFAQVQYSKLKQEFNISTVQAIISVKSEFGTNITKQDTLQVGGANQFGHSFTIPDVPVGQINETVEAFLFSDGVPVAPKISIDVMLNENVIVPPPPGGGGPPPAPRKSSLLEGLIAGATTLYFVFGDNLGGKKKK